MKNARLINNVIGGSYVADERIAGYALSQNLYAESVEERGNGFYFTTALRSVEGEKVLFQIGDGTKGCRGMFVASDNSIFAAYGDNVYRIVRNSVNGTYSYKSIYKEPYETTGAVCFTETGGVNSHVCWVNGTESLFAFPIDDEKSAAAGLEPPFVFRTPLRVYLTADEIKYETNEHVKPTQVASLNGCIVINDPETDTWYYTDAYILGGLNYKRSIYKLDDDGNIQYKSGSSYEVLTEEVDLSAEEPKSKTCYLWLDRYSKSRFSTAEYSADKLMGLCVCGDLMYMFGCNSVQVYSQSTTTDAQGFSSITFTSYGRNVRDIGLKVNESVCVVNGNVVFLGASARGERSVWVMNGGSPVRISTNAIERELDGVNIDEAYAIGWVQNGHQFYCLTIPSIKKTYCYDFATSQWHNRSSRSDDGKDSYWWARYAVNAEGVIVLASKSMSKVVALDKNVYEDYRGKPIFKIRTAPCITNDYSPFMVNDVMLLWNNGTTKVYDKELNEENPIVSLEVSVDGGNTFGDSMEGMGGKAGDYSNRTIWYGIGAGNMFVFRFTISAKMNVVITGAKISFTPLSHF